MCGAGVTWLRSGDRVLKDGFRPYRRAKGFGEVPVRMPDLKKKALGFYRISPDTYVCEDTGETLPDEGAKWGLW